ncbi:NADH dehydrogenase [ubiquinone] 1 alpha subcomplex assembly factor 2 isoform X1 [Scleropages formosus]|uniref:NADH:ubiquinone oxidoreductase complex assembly factor 2 n=1 Tax=Scleropages formosus TaxID=113540 RepID=A0A8C9RG86_SCLFO|nr:NADH dehydrogenase [ubiquinone] 1 alpha subcomplex assembly factor 2 isoform X1 [Scleropages formosus]
MSRIVSFLRKTLGIAKQHVGTDHLGNQYYFIPQQKTWTGRTIRAKRLVVSKMTESEYTEGSIPSEWDAWIRGRRKDPPTLEELEKNMHYREQIKQKAREAQEKDLALQAKEYDEGLVARPAQTLIKGHASATHFGQNQTSEDPVSTGNTFQPGSWTPSRSDMTKK